MRIEHIAIYVRDLEGVKNFFQTYFGANANDGYHNPQTGLCSYFLTFTDGARLELMRRPDQREREVGLRDTGYIHIAFSAGSKEEVDRLTKALADGGYQVLSGPRVTGDGYYESCILGPEGNQIEITE